MNDAITGLTDLKRAYENRNATSLAAKLDARTIIGYVGAAFPRELALAADALPIAITPQLGRPTPTADHYIEPVVSAEIRDLFESGVVGEFAHLDLLVITRPYAKLYYYLKEIYRQGRAPRLPPLHMFDLMQSRRDAVATYNEGRMRDLVDAIARVTNKRPDDNELAREIARSRRIRGLQQRLQDLRWQRALTGVDALIAFGAGAFLDPQAYEAALSEFVGTLASGAIPDRPRWLVVTSEPLSHSSLHRALEQAGGLVVAEDDAWGSRASGEDRPTHLLPMQALLHATCFDAATGQVFPAELREAWFESHVIKPEVDAVIFYIPPSDHQVGWDYPRLKAFAEHAGKPTLLIRHDARTEHGSTQIRAEASAFRDACAARTTSP